MKKPYPPFKHSIYKYLAQGIELLRPFEWEIMFFGYGFRLRTEEFNGHKMLIRTYITPKMWYSFSFVYWI